MCISAVFSHRNLPFNPGVPLSPGGPGSPASEMTRVCALVPSESSHTWVSTFTRGTDSAWGSWRIQSGLDVAAGGQAICYLESLVLEVLLLLSLLRKRNIRRRQNCHA